MQNFLLSETVMVFADPSCLCVSTVEVRLTLKKISKFLRFLVDCFIKMSLVNASKEPYKRFECTL